MTTPAPGDREKATRLIKDAENSSEPYDMVDHIATALCAEREKERLRISVRLCEITKGYLYVIEQMHKWVVEQYPQANEHRNGYQRPRALVSAQLRWHEEAGELLKEILKPSGGEEAK